MAQDYPSKFVTIASGQTVSDAAQIGNMLLAGIITDSGLNGVALTFQGSVDGSTYTALYDTSGNAISYTVAASRFVVFDPALWAGVKYLKCVSGTSETGATILELILLPMN